MAWNAPKTWLADEIVTAQSLNEQLRDNMLLLATAINTATGKIPALTSSYFENLSGANLTGIAKLAGTNTFGSGKQDFNAATGTRLIVPVGVNKWAV